MNAQPNIQPTSKSTSCEIEPVENEPLAILSHSTALELMRAGTYDNLIVGHECCDTPIPQFAPDRATLDRRLSETPQLLDLGLPANVLVSSTTGGRSNMTLRTRVCRAKLPDSSFIKIEDDLYCVSPEQLLVQLSPSSSRLELTLRICEFMGYYAIRSDDDYAVTYRNHVLTDPQRFLSHLKRLGDMRGTPKIWEALENVHPESHSPLESKLYQRIGLKSVFGGYGLPVLGLGEPEVADNLGFSQTGIKKPSILLPSDNGSFVGIDIYHDEGPSKGEFLERRTRVLEAFGIKCYLITQSDYNDLDELDLIMTDIAHDLGIARRHLSAIQEQRAYRERQALADDLDMIDCPLLYTNEKEWDSCSWGAF